jgi:protein-L-isoaspartate(D-aspartate) O-methyltransferase
LEELDFEKMRKGMVEEQLIARGISDKKVLDAFLKVPRHKFIDREFIENAYSDHPLPIGSSQTISQPYMVALMTEKLEVKSSDNVLEIGTGSAYQLAILAELAREVYSVERVESLAATSVKIMKELGYKNFSVKVGDGTLGWKEHSPYDGIIVTAGAPGVPESLLEQLKDGGRLVIPIGSSFGQALTLIEKRGKSITTTPICGCVFVPLIGKEGWAAG